MGKYGHSISIRIKKHFFALLLIVFLTIQTNGIAYGALSYTGKTTQAQITSTNAAHIISKAYTHVLGLIHPTRPFQNSADIGPGTYAALNQALMNKSRQVYPLSELPLDGITKTETSIRGDKVTSPGSANITHQFDYSSYWHSGEVTYNDFYQMRNRFSGRMAFSGVFYWVTGRLASVRCDFDDLNIYQDTSSFSQDGSLQVYFPGIQPSGQYWPNTGVYIDLLVKENAFQRTYELKDVALTIEEGVFYTTFSVGTEHTQAPTGSFYDPRYGYVVLDTPIPLLIESGDIYPSQGEFVVIGTNNTSAKLTFLSEIDTYRIEVDGNGDGIYEWNSGVLHFSIGVPGIISASPAGNEENTEIDQIVLVSFNKIMDPATINHTTFIVDPPFKATLGYTGRTAYLIPDVNLSSNTIYNITITNGIKDIDGVPLAGSYSWTFKTNSTSRIHYFPYPVSDAVYEPGGSLYFSAKDAKKVCQVDPVTGDVLYEHNLSYMPESMTIRSDHKRMFVSLLTKNHDDYWFDEDQEGYIAEFDLESGNKLKEFRVGIDPYDLSATSDGHLLITSGSGQWSYLESYNVDTEERVARVRLYQKQPILLNPSENFFSVVTTRTKPSSIRIFDLSKGQMAPDNPDSIRYTSDNRIKNYLYSDPTGRIVFTNWGDIFRPTTYTYKAKTYNGLDIPNKQRFTSSQIYAAAYDPLHGYLFTVEEYAIKFYDASNYKLSGYFSVRRGEKSFIFFDNSYRHIYYVTSGQNGTTTHVIPNPVSRINDYPFANFSVDKMAGATIDSFAFDASSSSDFQPGAEVFFRWDWNSDGAYDTAYSASPLAYHSFNTPGKNKITLQVTDSWGLSSETAMEVDIVGEGVPPVVLGKISDICADKNPEYMYAIDQENSALYFINTLSHQIVKKVDLPYEQPTSLAYSANDNNLYIVSNTSGSIIKYNVDTSVQSEIPFPLTVSGRDIEVAPNLRRIYVLQIKENEYHLAIIDMDSEIVLFETTINGSKIHIDETRQKMFTADIDHPTSNRHMYRYSTSGDQIVLEQTVSAPTNGYDISISPDGKHILCPAGTSNINDLVYDYDASNLNNVFGGWIIGHLSQYGLYKPNGKIVYGINRSNSDVSNYIYVMDAESYVEVRRLPFPNNMEYEYGVYAPNADGSVLVGFRRNDPQYPLEPYKMYFFQTAFEGDVNGDEVIDLADGILSMKIIEGVADTNTDLMLKADVNADKKIGIEEVIYILQIISSLR